MHFCVFRILSSLWCDFERYLYLACMTFWKTTLSAFFSFNISVIFWSRKRDVLSCFCCVPLFAPPWIIATRLLCPWDSPGKNTGLPCPSPGHLPDPGIEPTSPAAPALQADSLLLSHWESPGNMTCMCAKSLQSYLTLCNPVDCSPPGSSVQEILQSCILEWAAMPFSRGSSQLRDQTPVSYISCIGRQVLYHNHHLTIMVIFRVY